MSTCQQWGPEISWTVDDRTQDQMDSDLINSLEKAMGLPRHRRYSKTKPRHRREKSRRGVKPNVVTIDGAAYEVHEIPAPTRCEGCPWRSPCDGCRWQGVGTE